MREAVGGGARVDAAERDDAGARIGGPVGEAIEAERALAPQGSTRLGGGRREDRGEEGVVDAGVAGLGGTVTGAAEQAIGACAQLLEAF